ncbi:hypothetical protein FGO68_gene14028 [Halteria grandinella]|uniref:Uncharacterized protein n=1 Tax=Halteria grandinella TaxID=5974 RepID=A0A8J8NMW6_HALGN|nr:hypothetical protein FGO68_gene14028 [Halteria grandinella]
MSANNYNFNSIDQFNQPPRDPRKDLQRDANSAQRLRDSSVPSPRESSPVTSASCKKESQDHDPRHLGTSAQTNLTSRAYSSSRYSHFSSAQPFSQFPRESRLQHPRASPTFNFTPIITQASSGFKASSNSPSFGKEEERKDEAPADQDGLHQEQAREEGKSDTSTFSHIRSSIPPQIRFDSRHLQAEKVFSIPFTRPRQEETSQEPAQAPPRVLSYIGKRFLQQPTPLFSPGPRMLQHKPVRLVQWNRVTMSMNAVSFPVFRESEIFGEEDRLVVDGNIIEALQDDDVDTDDELLSSAIESCVHELRQMAKRCISHRSTNNMPQVNWSLTRNHTIKHRAWNPDLYDRNGLPRVTQAKERDSIQVEFDRARGRRGASSVQLQVKKEECQEDDIDEADDEQSEF